MLVVGWLATLVMALATLGSSHLSRGREQPYFQHKNCS